MAYDSGNGGAHGRAIQAITEARQNTRRYIYEMERSDDVRENAIFVDRYRENHPQKIAHAALLDYHAEVDQPEYHIHADEEWVADLSDERGHPITITVPKDDVVTKTVTESSGIKNITPSLSDIPTQEETLSLENLGYRWSGRQITVNVLIDSPYRIETESTELLRLWLPPRAVKAAYSQLNTVLSRIGLLAQTKAPIEHDPDPI